MNAITERTLPHSLDAERSVLGAILLHDTVLEDAADVLRPEDFFRQAHQRIFAQMLALHQHAEPVDLTTISERLTAVGQLEEVGGRGYIAALVDGMPRSVNVAHYAGIVRRYARLRRVIQAGHDMAASAYDADEDAAAIIDRAEQTLYGLTQDAPAAGFVSLADLMPKVLAQIEAWHQAKHGVTGVPSGFGALDTLTRGFQPGNLVILGARPGLGKSTLALNIAQHVAGLGQPVGFFSLEMSNEELAVRAVTAEARVDGYRLQRGWIRSQEEWARLSTAYNRLARLPLYIDESPFVSALDIRSRARRLKSKVGLALLIVDYTQLMISHERRDNRALEIASVTRALKALAKDLAIPVIGLSQLNRSVEDRDGGRPRLSDLRESGSLEQDSDLVLFIHRDEALVDQQLAEIIVAKQRNGPTGSVKLGWCGEEARFVNVEPVGAM